MAPKTAANKKAKPTPKADPSKVHKAAGVTKKTAGRNRMLLMQTFFKKHRAQFKDLDFKEQQQELGKLWKAAPENPKNK